MTSTARETDGSGKRRAKRSGTSQPAELLVSSTRAIANDKETNDDEHRKQLTVKKKKPRALPLLRARAFPEGGRFYCVKSGERPVARRKRRGKMKNRDIDGTLIERKRKRKFALYLGETSEEGERTLNRTTVLCTFGGRDGRARSAPLCDVEKRALGGEFDRTVPCRE